MPSSAVPRQEDLDRLAERLGPCIVEIFREWEIPEIEQEELVRAALVRLSYKWSRIHNPERWLLAALSKEARSRSAKSRKEPEE